MVSLPFTGLWPLGSGAEIDIPWLPTGVPPEGAALPAPGRLRIGDVELPSGRPLPADPSRRPGVDPVPPVLWATDARVPDAAVVWRLLVDEFPRSGLWPLLLAPLGGDDDRPWGAGEFRPEPESMIGELDAEEVLSAGWTGAVVPIGGPSVHPMIERALAPFGAPFPGLARPLDRSPGPRTVPDHALCPAGAQRIGLVCCRRPADAVGLIGWDGACNLWDSPAQVSAVLRSWEDRFGVVLVGLAFATVTLLVPAAPDDDDHAVHIAAEITALCRDALYPQDLRFHPHDGTLIGMAQTLFRDRVWRLWFD